VRLLLLKRLLHLQPVPRIPPPDIHHLSAAIGWLELGNVREARSELERVNPELQDHPDVLEASWLLCSEERDWTRGLDCARRLLLAAPKRATGWLHQAYALRRVPGGGLSAAWDALLPAWQMFPKEPVIPYNLACYACQLGRRTEALVWLKRALSAGNKEDIKKMALDDRDLEPLRSEIPGL
jgi:tetratricopeptide (TPR) repeat protein